MDRLPGGAMRFASPRCTMVLSRLGPARLHLAIAGEDRGELGDDVFSELDREWDRFAQPLTLRVDTRRATAPVDGVRDRWAAWFRRRRERLERVHMLVPGAVLDLTARVVRQLAGIEDLLHVGADAARFDQALGASAGRLGSDRSAERPLPVERTTLPDGLRLSDGACAYVYRRPTNAVLRLDIQGHDAGHLGAVPLDELMQWQRGQLRSSVLFVDASGARSVDERVRDEWVAWIRAHRDDHAQMSILAGSPLMRLTFGLAREAAQAGQRMRIFDQPAPFEEALARATGRA